MKPTSEGCMILIQQLTDKIIAIGEINLKMLDEIRENTVRIDRLEMKVESLEEDMAKLNADLDKFSADHL